MSYEGATCPRCHREACQTCGACHDCPAAGGDADQGLAVAWATIEDAALNDPVLHQLVTVVRARLLSREAALMHAVLALSKVRATQHQQLVDLLNVTPIRLTLPVTPGG